MSSANSQQMLLGSGLPPATVTYQAMYTPTIVGTTATQAGVSFGPVANGRLVPIAVQWNATVVGSTITSATIGGFAASVVIQGTALNTSSPYQNLAIIAAFVPTGTSGTVLLNFGGGGSIFVEIFAWQTTNVQNAPPFGTGSAVSATSPTVATCNVQRGGIIIAHANTLVVSAPFTFTGVTKDYESSTPSGLGTIGGGSAQTALAVTGASFQMSDPGGPAGGPFRSMIVASFR